MKKKNNQQRYSRNHILCWLNNELSINCNSIQQLGTGTIYCNLINSYYPNTINENLINKFPNSQYQFVNNFKLVQSAFIKLKITKTINVSIFFKQLQIQKLIKMKYQENWELITFIYSCLIKQNVNKQHQVACNSLKYSTPHTFNKKRNYNEFASGRLNTQTYRNIQIKKACYDQYQKQMKPKLEQKIQMNEISTIQKIKEILGRSEESNEQKIRELKTFLNIEQKWQKQMNRDYLHDEQNQDSFTMSVNSLLFKLS